MAATAQIDAAARSSGAFPFAAESLDAAIAIVLEPGAYTARVDSLAGGGGTVLLEIYDVP